MGFTEHESLTREVAGLWKRQLEVSSLSKSADCWLRAQMAETASILLQRGKRDISCQFETLFQHLV